MKITDILHEGKQSVMYHGTSSSLFRSIMTQGMRADPPDRAWSEDPSASAGHPSRESLPGSYWTTNLMTAMSSTSKSIKKFGGNRMYIVALIQEQNAFADEDSVNSKIERAYGRTMEEAVPGVSYDAVQVHLSNMQYRPEQKAMALRLFPQYMHEELDGGQQMPIDANTMQRIFHDFMMRKLAHIVQGDKWGLARWFNEGEVPAIPSVADAERAYHQDLDWITRRYRATASSDKETFNHTLRMPLDVGFRGSNRIVCIIEEILDKATFNRELRVLYGTPPQQMIEAWQKSVGKWPLEMANQVTETRRLPGPRVAGSGKDFRQDAGTNRSKKQPGRLMGSGKLMKVRPGFVG